MGYLKKLMEFGFSMIILKCRSNNKLTKFLFTQSILGMFWLLQNENIWAGSPNSNFVFDKHSTEILKDWNSSLGETFQIQSQPSRVQFGWQDFD